MDDDWDDGVTVPTPQMNGISSSDGGIKFSSGRGFRTAQPSNSFNNDFNNGTKSFASDDNGGQRWRGGGGAGRQGGFRSGFRDDNNKDDFNNFKDNDDDWGTPSGNGDEGRGRGGRGGSRGGGRGRGRGRGGGGGNFGDRNNFDDKDNKNDGSEPPKPKEIYIPVERVTEDELFENTITSGVNFMKLDEIEVKVTGENVPPPISSFSKSGLREHLINNVEKSKYTKPTPIQKYAIPIILGGRDLMACAQTGSGKTAAFLLPVLNKLLETGDMNISDSNACRPQVIIMTPTRELTIQIYEQAKKFGYNSVVKISMAYGGTSVSHQRSIVQSGCHILVATPGRLKDFVARKYVLLDNVKFFILDEADRMLDMGFKPVVEEMLDNPDMAATGERQTLMFSATFPEEVQHLAGKFLDKYVFVAVGIVGGASTDVEQIFYEVTRFDKRNKLMEMLKNNNERTVVFVETKRNADFLATLLSEHDIQSTSIHGDRLQSQREEALFDFKRGVRNILVATGVAARGLDIKGVQHVINYDLPKHIDEYVHRIGRTGRVGNRGKATSFYDASSDYALAGALANLLRQAGHKVPDFLDKCGGDAPSNMFGGEDVRGQNFGEAQNFTQKPAELVEEGW